MHYFKDYRVIPVYLCNNMNLAHFDAVVEGGHVQRAASLAVGDGGGVRAPRQHPADEVLPAGVDGLVEGDVAAVVLYRVVQLFLTPESVKYFIICLVDLFLFFVMTSLKQHMEYFRC